MASMYTSSNQYPPLNVTAAQCSTTTIIASEATARDANGATDRSVADSSAPEVTYRHDTVGTMALVRAGCPHTFSSVTAEAGVSKRATGDRILDSVPSDR